MDGTKLYNDMCDSLRRDGLSTEGMYPAYLRGEFRKARKELRELKDEIQELKDERSSEKG